MNNGNITTEPTRPKRRLALRWFIAAALLLLIVGGFVVAIPIYQERQAAARLEARGATIFWQFQGPGWLKPRIAKENLVGPQPKVPVFSSVRGVSIDLRGHDVATLQNDLRFMPNLLDLSVWNTSIGATRLEFLVSHPKLEWLVLTAMPLTDSDLATVGQLKELRYLDLSYTEITDDGLKSLSGLTQLESLRLDGTQVSDAGMRHLTALPNLTDLSVSNTQVTDEGLNLLSGKLPDLAVSDD